MDFKSIKCIIKAIPLFIKSGEFVPHLYEEKERYTANIFYTDHGFRIAGSLNHAPDEHFVRNAILIGCECKRCGRKMMEWQRNEDVPVIGK